MNSVSESLYFGVPLVMMPQTAEQGGVARRVLQLGAGVKLEKYDSVSLQEAVRKVLTDPAYRENASRISQSFHNCTGAAGAADKILRLCNVHLINDF